MSDDDTPILCGNLFWSPKGYGFIQVNPIFKREEYVTRLDALSDWSIGLCNEYQHQYDAMIKDFEDKKFKQETVMKARRDIAKRKTKKK